MPAKNLPDFLAPWWLPGRHWTTLYGAGFAPAPRPAWHREAWATPDHDFIHVDCLASRPDSPTLTILHGLEGSSDSPYLRAMAARAHGLGWNIIAPNFRGCSGEINLAPRTYHAGDSQELGWILERVKERFPGDRYAAGVSLGGNMLLKWLGEQGDRAGALLTGAAAIAAPLDLVTVGDHLGQGFNRFYTHIFLRTLKPKARLKHQQFPGLFDLRRALSARTLREFDDAFVAPVHGFQNVEDYWTRASSKPWISQIRLPTLLLNARDDPFIPTQVLPDARSCPDLVMPLYTRQGGHVGFVSGSFPGNLDWMPDRVIDFFGKL